MKQLMLSFILAFVFLFTSKTQAQYQYIPTAVDSAVWLIGANFDISTQQYLYRLVLYTKGDTMVNNIHYYKVYRQIKGVEGAVLEMLIRDNLPTQTVHGILMDPFASCQQLFIDVVLFDFNSFASAGTMVMNCSNSYTIEQIDTFFLYGMNRRVIDLVSFSDQLWIEGIGWNFSGVSMSGCCELIDYCRGTPEDCGAHLWLDTKSVKIDKGGKLYPNPARSACKVELSRYLTKGKLQVFNTLGQLQYEGAFEGETATLPLERLPQGVYQVVVFEDGALVFGEKLLVE